MKYSSRFFLYAPLVMFLALATTVGVYWWYSADALSKKLDALNGHEAVPGITLSFKSKSVSGFPFNLDVVFKNFAVTVATPHGPSSWTTENFALHALTYGRNQMLFEAAGQQMLRWHDLQKHGHTLPFQVGELHASAINDDKGLVRADMVCIGFSSPALSAGQIQFHIRSNFDGRTMDTVVGSDSVRLSPPLASLFGDTIGHLRASVTISPSAPFRGLRTGTASWVESVDAWRAAGGIGDVSAFDIWWDRLRATGKGRLSLDESHFADGLLDVKIVGIESLVDAANHRGVHGAPNDGIAAALLARAAKAGNNPDGAMGVVVGFHAGRVSVGDEPATTAEPVY